MYNANIYNSHPGATEDIKLGVFSVARSFIPGSRCAVDKTMEETFMRHAKSKGGAGGGSVGISGITQNYAAYQRWIASMSERSKYMEMTKSLAGLRSDINPDVRHRDLRPLEIKKSELSVIKTVDAVESFMDPFSISENNSLFSLSSGGKMSVEVEKDVLGAEEFGKKQKTEFIEERLEVNKNFFQPIKRANLKTMGEHSKKVKVTTKENKVVELKQQGIIAFQLLMKCQNMDKKMDLQEVMKYQLTPVPSCLGSSDGFLGKTNKAKGMQYLLKDTFDSDQLTKSDTLLVIDGNAMFYSMTEVPATFRDICEKIFRMIPKNQDVIFSTDMYSTDSIKSQERERRGSSEKFLISGPNIRRPADWKLFLSNDENKKSLAEMMLTVWSSDSFSVLLGERKVEINYSNMFFKC